MKSNSYSPKDIKTLANAARIINANKKNDKAARTLASGLTSLVSDLAGGGIYAPQINQTATIVKNLRRQPLTFDRPTLNYLYMENGIIRTAIDQPVDDSLRGGVDFESQQLDADDIKRLSQYFEDNGVWEVIKRTMKWARLFGGAGLVINNGQDMATELNLDEMNEKTPLQFYDADRWELSMPNDKDKRPEDMGSSTQLFYYYALPLHKSRVLTVKGDAAPSLVRRMFMGWGLSEVEKMVRDLNQYIKAHDVVFELLDEAKIDVYRMEGYKTALARPQGQANMASAISLTNSMKNFMNALVLDIKDEYEQKQLTFSGLAEILKEIRIGIAATLRMPVTKLFGMSSTGFNSGEDDIENYNSMIESDIRSRERVMIKGAMYVCCKKLFGEIPDDLTFKFKNLRIVTQKEEEDIKAQKQLIILNNYDRALMTAEEAMKAQRAEGLLTSEKTAAETGLTEDFPTRPIDSVRETIKDGEDPGDGSKPANDKPGKVDKTKDEKDNKEKD